MVDADWAVVPNKDAPPDTGIDGEELEETPANKLLARLFLFVSTFGNSDSRGFGGAMRSKAGEGLAGEEYIEEGAACPDWKEDEDI